jgi:hypothetical protein
MNMVRLDALIAEIAGVLDVELLNNNPSFAALPRFNRTHFIMHSLVRGDIARAEKWGRRVLKWWPSRRLEQHRGVKYHGIPGAYLRIERPIGISTLADEFSEFLEGNDEKADEVASRVCRRFAKYELGVLEYCGKRDGLCRFKKTHSR